MSSDNLIASIAINWGTFGYLASDFYFSQFIQNLKAEDIGKIQLSPLQRHMTAPMKIGTLKN